MNKGIIFLIIGMGLFLFALTSCQKNNIQSDSNTSKIVERLNAILPGSGDDAILQQNIQTAIDTMKNDVLPTVSGKDKDELNEAIAYFEGIKIKVPGYLENEDNLIEASKVLMRLNEFFARTNPNDFDVNLYVSANYTRLANSIGYHQLSSEKAKIFNKEFNQKSIQSAKALVDNFPDNPMSYGQLAHTMFYTGSDKKEVVRILNKCIEIDKKSDYCKEFLVKMKDG